MNPSFKEKCKCIYIKNLWFLMLGNGLIEQNYKWFIFSLYLSEFSFSYHIYVIFLDFLTHESSFKDSQTEQQSDSTTQH